MAKVQSRRAVTLNRGVFERLKAHCARERVPVAALVQELVERHLRRQSVPPTGPGVAPDAEPDVEQCVADQSLRSQVMRRPGARSLSEPLGGVLILEG